MLEAIKKIKFIIKLTESNISNKIRNELINKNSNELLNELEELENRSCESCKYFDKICILFGCGDIGGCGIYYEKKDN